MLNRIRIKFITLSMTALFVLLFVIIAGMNVVNYRTIIGEADSTLFMLSENKGKFPPFAGKELPPFMSQETPYETRYFSMVMSHNKELIDADISRIVEVDVKKAYEYAISVMKMEEESGFIEQYRYISQKENGLQRITFLDVRRKMYSYQTFLKTSIVIGVLGYIGFFLVIVIFSRKIVRPVAESYEKQRRFITDAGHEIKTPLAIIKADVDVLEMDWGENEWLEDIQKQAKRLAGLTNDLVYLSRMEEEEKDMQMIEFPFSDVVQETVSSFQALTKTQNKNLQCTIPPLMSLTGNEKAIRQLINILIDNAIKYSPEKGLIFVDAKKQGEHIALFLGNTSLIEGYIDDYNLDKGFVYTIAGGQKFRIPVSVTKNK